MKLNDKKLFFCFIGFALMSMFNINNTFAYDVTLIKNKINTENIIAK